MHALACWPQTCLLGPQGLAAFDDRQASGRGTPAVGKAPALLNGSLLMPTPDVCSISMLCFFVAYPTLAHGEDAWSSETTIIVPIRVDEHCRVEYLGPDANSLHPGLSLPETIVVDL